MTSFYVNYLLKNPLLNYSHILRYWGLECHHVNLGKTQFHLGQLAMGRGALAPSSLCPLPSSIYLPGQWLQNLAAR